MLDRTDLVCRRMRRTLFEIHCPSNTRRATLAAFDRARTLLAGAHPIGDGRP